MSKPRIAFIDIETSPILGYAWAIYDTNILGVKEPVKVMCFGWKWLGENKVNVLSLPDYKNYKPGVLDDSLLMKDVWKVLDEADVVVAHNGDSFDIKIINARFLVHGLNPPSDYKTVDTLKVSKKYFRMTTNKLDDVGGYLDEGRKASTGGFQTWVDCWDGDRKAWERMTTYNARDVELLERVYLRLRPFIGNHPDLNLIAGRPIKLGEFVCGSCQSLNTQKRGFAVTKAGRYQRYSCNDCGSWSTGPYERVK